jgi:hypothetical protein
VNHLVELCGRLVVPLVQEVLDCLHSWDLVQLRDTITEIWELLDPDGTEAVLSNIELLPDMIKTQELPYKDTDGEFYTANL